MKPGTFIRKAIEAVGVLALASALAACPGGDPMAPAAPEESGEADPQILLLDDIPQPGLYTAQFGEVVVWQNAGSHDHSVSTYGTPDEWEDTLLEPGETFRHSFSGPGEYAYICVVHGEVGTVIVVDYTYDDGFDQEP